MSAVVRERPINLVFQPNTPHSVIIDARRRFSKYLIPADDERINYFDTDIHKKIEARMTPGKYLRNLR